MLELVRRFILFLNLTKQTVNEVRILHYDRYFLEHLLEAYSLFFQTTKLWNNIPAVSLSLPIWRILGKDSTQKLHQLCDGSILQYSYKSRETCTYVSGEKSCPAYKFIILGVSRRAFILRCPLDVRRGSENTWKLVQSGALTNRRRFSNGRLRPIKVKGTPI